MIIFSGNSPPELLLDEPLDLPIVEFHSQKLSFIYKMISGNKNQAAVKEIINTRVGTVRYGLHFGCHRSTWLDEQVGRGEEEATR